MRDMVSLTPMAEYIDMIYTRLAIEMPRHEKVHNWWLELRPPIMEEEGVGVVLLKAIARKPTGQLIITYRGNMHAVQQGAVVGSEELEIVVEHHIAKFVESINSDD